MARTKQTARKVSPHTSRHAPFTDASCSPPEARLLVNSSPPRALPRARQPRVPLEVSRSPIVSGLEPSPSVKSDATRSRPSSSSASSPSSASSVKSHRISRPTFVSSRRPSWRCRRLPRLTLSRSSRTPISPPSTPSASPSNPKISLSRVVSAGSARRCITACTVHTRPTYLIIIIVLYAFL
ncbi:hypothetical protein C8F04DRAFT_23670 [Mycena alexandri]|uniref:Uncharacterized protein n=1 Tax=Mycena alexandri TaxID=1745969 RepID=A0AAD6TKV9_9AGAR|nr:hypothetical protein C8F04DRAFT_23670 [Mycena alexandri]